jgi:hypothetical protein
VTLLQSTLSWKAIEKKKKGPYEKKPTDQTMGDNLQEKLHIHEYVSVSSPLSHNWKRMNKLQIPLKFVIGVPQN